MAPTAINPVSVCEFRSAQGFYDWLAEQHDKRDEVWVKIHKVGSGLASITAKQGIDVVLCWGWIDGIRKGLNESSFMQRYTPRRSRSIWSQINIANVERLIKEGRMTPHGLREVEAAKADGRWARAYGSGQDMKIPVDLQAAIDAEPKAKQMLAGLTEQNRFALAFRVHNLKTQAGRKRKIEAFVDMLKRGETIYPQKTQKKK
ncbi:YdeI/OmpD-associated family protein [Roseateles sp.]|uniref:YdeI/OmpD-associated family protein n=1 Tax=Roseateles sp. TaxID=1971397 RepID=UPI00326359E9